MDFLFRELALWTGPTGWQLVAWRAPFGLAVTVVFALLAWMLRSVTRAGALAGAAITFAIWIAWPPLFVALFAVFLLTAGATRFGYARQQQRGAADQRDGRSVGQVIANLAVAAAAAMAAQYGHHVLFFAAAVAALAEAACDTVSSEIGQALAARAFLVTTFRQVQPGVNGGISAIGTLAGCAAAFAVAAVAGLMKVIAWPWLLPVMGAAIAGMLFDSLLGATLEGRGWIGNNVVNLMGTAFAAGLAIALV